MSGDGMEDDYLYDGRATLKVGDTTQESTYPDLKIYVEETDKHTALQEQEGGSHYKDMKIQPIEYCVANKLNPCQTHMIRYASRYPNKSGAEDLRKVIHIAKLALFLEYGESYE